MLARRLHRLASLTKMYLFSRRSRIGTQQSTSAGLPIRLRFLHLNMPHSKLNTIQDNPDSPEGGNKFCLHSLIRLVADIRLGHRLDIDLLWLPRSSQDNTPTCRRIHCRQRQLLNARHSNLMFSDHPTWEHKSRARHSSSSKYKRRDRLVPWSGRLLQPLSQVSHYLNLKRQSLPVSCLMW